MVFTVTYDPVPNIRLVKAVQKYPVLYDTVNHYPYRKAVDEAWEKVAEELNDTNVCCKERWLNLRNSFKRFLRQKRSNAVKKPYYLAEHMEFLEPYISFSVRYEKKKKDLESMSDTEMSLPLSPDKDVEDDDDDFSNDYLDQTSSGELVAVNESKTNNTTAQTAITFAGGQINTAEENFSKNPDLAFFISILPDVHAMTEEQKEIFRKEVVDSIDNILYAEDLSEF